MSNLAVFMSITWSPIEIVNPSGTFIGSLIVGVTGLSSREETAT